MKRHNLSSTRLYRTWQHMKDRCYRKNDIKTWSTIIGVPHQTIRGRLWRSKSIEDALKGGHSHS